MDDFERMFVSFVGWAVAISVVVVLADYSVFLALSGAR